MHAASCTLTVWNRWTGIGMWTGMLEWPKLPFS